MKKRKELVFGKYTEKKVFDATVVKSYMPKETKIPRLTFMQKLENQILAAAYKGETLLIIALERDRIPKDVATILERKGFHCSYDEGYMRTTNKLVQFRIYW